MESLPDENVLVGGAAAMLIMLLDGVGMIAFGDYGRLNPLEKTMIEEPLKRILVKVSPSNLNMIGKYTDPVLLIMGLLTWVSRVTMEGKRREQVKEKTAPVEPEPMTVKPEPPKSVNVMETNPPMDIISNFVPVESNAL